MPNDEKRNMIEHKAKLLWSIWNRKEYKSGMDLLADWSRLHEKERESWEHLAKAIPGSIDIKDAAGCYATVHQGDTIRNLRKIYKKTDDREETFIGQTAPYGEMILVFEYPRTLPDPRGQTVWTKIVFLVHPDGQYEPMHKENIR